jgi:hypothetical protein
MNNIHAGCQHPASRWKVNNTTPPLSKKKLDPNSSMNVNEKRSVLNELQILKIWHIFIIFYNRCIYVSSSRIFQECTCKFGEQGEANM